MLPSLTAIQYTLHRPPMTSLCKRHIGPNYPNTRGKGPGTYQQVLSPGLAPEQGPSNPPSTVHWSLLMTVLYVITLQTLFADSVFHLTEECNDYNTATFHFKLEHLHEHGSQEVQIHHIAENRIYHVSYKVQTVTMINKVKHWFMSDDDLLKFFKWTTRSHQGWYEH